ncbi:Bcser1 [Botrytis cinerea B05.10]|uniref:Bcser1 n=3 Tax=Botryotinia fuckeliana TaxID=40559 RepID=A0A384JVF6_BOTFB|nr:Bcser1 [Botrytis cinerea B05.10]ATZ54237.1 Bcser1 [Botrytis cinerea B05.10]EMR82670.1 putative subtilisin-like protease pr1a protein [Botrytis cinerea BcDW1]CCD54154.1 similar to subtilisin-like serine protease PR1A (secreted protein) [Botrytis cinerea T4]
MAGYLTVLTAFAAAFAPVFGAPAARVPHPKIKTPTTVAKDIVADSYIVVYNTDITPEVTASHVDFVNAIVSKRDNAVSVGANYKIHDFAGYQISADEATIVEIANKPEVAYIEKDQKVYASALTTQSGSTWGLGRISHRAKGTTSYIYDTTAGSGVTVYVVDTGVYAAHSQFGGRASMGANFVSGSANTDENGHGTHCAGTIGGSTYGVAKAAKIVGVKVLDASGSGTNSGVISGIQWVATNGGAKSVLSMSLGGSYSAAVNSAVTSTVAAGVTVVVAAGNDNTNAANTSPASTPNAITVGAIDSNDARASFSNYGAVLDVFAPGVNVLSSWIGSTSATNTISGTSMATPHVAGLAAYLIALEGLSTPAAVVARIKALATANLITSPGSGSPNLIAYNGNGS